MGNTPGQRISMRERKSDASDTHFAVADLGLVEGGF